MLSDSEAMIFVALGSCSGDVPAVVAPPPMCDWLARARILSLAASSYDAMMGWFSKAALPTLRHVVQLPEKLRNEFSLTVAFQHSPNGRQTAR